MIPYFIFDKINIGSITLHVWGLMVGLGFSAGYLLLLSLAKKDNIAAEKMAGLALAIFSGGALGARLLFLSQSPAKFLNDISLLWSREGGAMFMGGLLGAAVGGYFYVRIAKLDLWTTADLLVLPAALGIGIGRLGCFFINDHQGAATNLPWGILWPDNVARHPVALYESLAGFLLFGFLLFARRLSVKSSVVFDKRGIFSYAGNAALFFWAYWGTVRFFLDFTRESRGALADARWGIFSTSQWLALLLALTAIWLLARNKKPVG